MVNQQMLGSLAFLVGILVAILAGTASMVVPTIVAYVPLVLVVLGLIVGFLNIADKEVQPFLTAGIALILVGLATGLDTIPVVGPALKSMLGAIAQFATPAVLVVSLKAFYALSKEPTGK